MPSTARALERLRAAAVAGREAGRRRLARRSGGTVPGLLSLIVPMYNVEAYLDACLLSLRGQDYRHVEIIVVDDGSPDRSIDIARRHRREDGRVRIVRRPNGGLSAARNTGVAAAYGEFLAFVDSDDTVTAPGYARAVTGLQASGSDFAVLPYQRLKGQRLVPPAPWIRAVHRADRSGTTLAEFPEILCNAVACSKVFRTSFWRDRGLRFVEGIIYEDQQLTAEAYARSERFDVYRTMLYNWRVRDDATSISQLKRDPRHVVSSLTAQLSATAASIGVLRTYGSDEIALARLLQVLRNDLTFFLARVPLAGPDYWQALVEALPRLLDAVPEDVLRAELPSWSKRLYRAVLDDDRDAAVRLLDARATRRDEFRVVREDGELYVEDEEPRAGTPARREDLLLSRQETLLQAGVRSLEPGPDRVRLTGWAIIRNLDLADLEPALTAQLVDATGRSLPLAITPLTADWLDEVPVEGSVWCDYRKAGFELEVDLAGLPDGEWHIDVTVRAGGLERTAPLTERPSDAWFQAPVPVVLPAGPGRIAHLRCYWKRPLSLAVSAPPVVVRLADTTAPTAGSVVLRVDGERVERVELRSGEQVLQPKVESRDADAVRVRFDLPHAGPRRWHVVADGQPVPAAPTLGGAEAVEACGTVTLVTDREGRATVRLHDAVGVAGEVVIEDNGLLVRLEADGTASSATRARLRSVAASVDGTVAVGADGTLEVWVPWQVARFGEPARPLPLGEYLLELADEGGTFVPVLAGRRVLPTLPRDAMPADVRAIVTAMPEGGDRVLRVSIEPPLLPDERGRRHRATLRQLAHQGSGTGRAVLFRTLFGEVTNDSAGALHEELRRRGSDLALQWSITDHSVGVPDGGEGLIENSRRWHEALGDAGWLVVNMHQPEWFHRPPAQRIVQTFHGYPYKLMGRANWSARDLAPGTIGSYYRRAAEWTHLVSPSRYATPLLLEEFFDPDEPPAAAVVEAGYPRNDALLAPDAAARGQRVRAALGLPSDAFVVLYAPTFRDALSVDGKTAQRADFFDAEEFLARSDPRAFVLVRGHAFHARGGEAGRHGDRLLDVTHHPDVTDLILASDAAILDYSSLRFDYALTRKPMVFLVPDEEEYHALRPGLLPYDATSPGPHVRDTAGAAEALRDPEGLRRRYADAVETFIATYMEKEDGHAAARVVDAVFGLETP